ncbi:MAG: hypothetical protein ACFFBD_09140 [Candidatus Hodarchaeota archaeon]
MWGMILCVVGSIFFVLDVIFALESIPDARQGVFMIIGTLIYTLGFLCFHIFIERNKPEIQVKWNFLVLCTVGLSGGAYLAFATNPISENFTLPLVLWSVAGIEMFLNGAWVHWKIYLATNREIMPLFQTLALLIISFGFFIGFLGSIDLIPGSLGNMIQFIGLLLYLLPYIANINYMYRLPVQIQMIGVFNIAGIPIFHITWNPRIEENIDLLGGAFQAMSSLLNEALFVNEPVNLIKAPKGAIMLRQYDTLTVIVLAETTNAIMANSLDRFLREFTQISSFDDQVLDGVVTSQDEEKIKEEALALLMQTFPYLELPENVSI